MVEGRGRSPGLRGAVLERPESMQLRSSLYPAARLGGTRGGARSRSPQMPASESLLWPVSNGESLKDFEERSHLTLLVNF